ncbi:hypothetical protein KCU74_g94, partial [Aureobasidium melanogenum]
MSIEGRMPTSSACHTAFAHECKCRPACRRTRFQDRPNDHYIPKSINILRSGKSNPLPTFQLPKQLHKPQIALRAQHKQPTVYHRRTRGYSKQFVDECKVDVRDEIPDCRDDLSTAGYKVGSGRIGDEDGVGGVRGTGYAGRNAVANDTTGGGGAGRRSYAGGALLSGEALKPSRSASGVPRSLLVRVRRDGVGRAFKESFRHRIERKWLKVMDCTRYAQNDKHLILVVIDGKPEAQRAIIAVYRQWPSKITFFAQLFLLPPSANLVATHDPFIACVRRQQDIASIGIELENIVVARHVIGV